MGLALIVVVLAALQYEWSGQVGEAQRERMQATLRTAMNQFREDLHQELMGICLAFETNQADVSKAAEQLYAERYREWRRRAPYPDLVANLFLWDERQAHPGLFRLSVDAEQFEPADCPPRFADLCGDLRLRRPQLPSVSGPTILPFAWTLEAGIPALVHPLFKAQQRNGQQAGAARLAGYVVIELSRASLQEQFFPELVQRYFGGPDGLLYQVAVLSGSDPASVIYVSDPIPPKQILASPDAVIQLFGPRHEDRLNLQKEKGPGAHGGFANADVPPHLLLFRRNRGLVRRFRSSVIVPRLGGWRWQLVVKHRSGSVEEAVTAVRHRNLAVSFGILLALAMSMAMLVVWTQRAERLAKLQVDFVAGVSHELRTPLAVISSAADNLAAGVVEVEEHVQRYGTLIGSEAHRLSDMVQQILLFAAGKAGRVRYEVRPVEIGEMIDRALSETRAMIDEAGFTVEKHIQPGLPPVLADASALIQCLENLIANAVKYGRDKHWMGIRGQMARTARGPEIEVTIEDKGMGIDSEDLPHIFEPFYRGRAVTAAQIHGTGLGLSLAKRVTEAMGGRLSVISVPKGGSAFTLHIPAFADGKPALENTASSNPSMNR